MTIFLLYTFSGIPRYLSAVHAAAPTQQDQALGRLKKLFDALEAAQREIPRDTFDPKAIIKKVGRNPVKLFEWVRDETVLVPYQGVLRGPEGVLMDRLGNSLDRALLLHTLLREAGHQARLARGPLSPDQAKELLQGTRPFPRLEQGDAKSAVNTVDQVLGRYATDYGLDPGEMRKTTNKVKIQQQRMAEDVAQRVEEQTAAIVAAVGLPDASAEDEERARQQLALQDHWWVQLRDKSGWIDLDPTLISAQPNKTLTRAKATMQPQDLGDDFYHTVTIRVIVEIAENGKLKEKQVLGQKLAPYRHLGERIVLRHVPMNWPEDLDLSKVKDPLKRMRDEALKQKEWLPVLTVEKRQIQKYSFNVDGYLIDPSEPHANTVRLGKGIQKKTRDALESLNDLFGSLPGYSPESESKPTPAPRQSISAATAEWIEYEISVPGRKPQKIRRQIFDLIGPASRVRSLAPAVKFHESHLQERAFALLGETEILPIPNQLSSEFFLHQTVLAFVANQEKLIGLLRDSGKVQLQDLAKQVNEIAYPPGPSYSLAVVRNTWSRFRRDNYLDRPNIFSYHRTPRLNRQGNLLSRESFDIVANYVAVHPKARVSPFLIRAEQGIIDTNAEAFLAAVNCRWRVNTRNCSHVENTAEIFEASKMRGIDWLTVRNVQDPDWQALKARNDIRARVEKDLRAGYAVIIPGEVSLKDNVPVNTWWRVNQINGESLGIGQDGRGTAGAEYLVTMGKVIGTIGLVLIGLNCFHDSLETLEEESKRSGVSRYEWAAIFGAHFCLGFAIISLAFPFWPLLLSASVGIFLLYYEFFKYLDRVFGFRL